MQNGDLSAGVWVVPCRADPVEPLFGTLVWAMWRSLRLTFRKVLGSAENKKLFLTTMVQLITTATARQTDPALLRECLNIVRLWLLEPENGGKPATPKPLLACCCTPESSAGITWQVAWSLCKLENLAQILV